MYFSGEDQTWNQDQMVDGESGCTSVNQDQMVDGDGGCTSVNQDQMVW